MNYSPLENEKEIVLKAQRGDEKALTKLIVHFTSKIEALLLAKGISSSDAREIIQITWIKVWKKIKDFKGDSSFSTWCGRIAINAFCDVKRKNSRMTSLEAFKNSEYESMGDFSSDLNSLFSGKLVDERSPDLILDEKERTEERKRRIKKLIKSLNEIKRETVELVLVKNLSYREAAKKQKVPLGTIMSRLHYARKKMREADKWKK